jgi:hypothetical protein
MHDNFEGVTAMNFLPNQIRGFEATGCLNGGRQAMTSKQYQQRRWDHEDCKNRRFDSPRWSHQCLGTQLAIRSANITCQ